MPSIVFSRTSSAMFSMQPRLVDLVGNLGDDDRHPVALLDSSIAARARTVMRTAAGRVGLEDAVAADDEAAGGKSGPGTTRRTAFSRASRRLAALFDRARCTPSMTSPMLCGGMLVAMPTAMPAEPLTSRFGNVVGQDRRLFRGLVVVGDEVDGLLVEVRHHRFGQRLAAAPRCSASPPAGRRRPNRSCPGRRPGDSAC